jgi:hypothetical protein
VDGDAACVPHNESFAVFGHPVDANRFRAHGSPPAQYHSFDISSIESLVAPTCDHAGSAHVRRSIRDRAAMRLAVDRCRFHH